VSVGFTPALIPTPDEKLLNSNALCRRDRVFPLPMRRKHVSEFFTIVVKGAE
jgi:hypothetical protein